MQPYLVQQTFEKTSKKYLGLFGEDVQTRTISRYRIRNGVQAEVRGSFELCYCPPGMMNEKTRQTTQGFWMMNAPVTRGLWYAVMKSHQGEGDRLDTPVTEVSWVDAIHFANRLSKLDQRTPRYRFSKDGEQTVIEAVRDSDGYRLPNCDEWLYAARSGQKFEFSGSDTLDDVAWYSGNSDKELKVVKKKKPNDWLLYDLTGNVAEWLEDVDPNQKTMLQRATDTELAYHHKYIERLTIGGNYRGNEKLSKLNSSQAIQLMESKLDYTGFRLIIG